MTELIIRLEADGDADAIRQVNVAAFGQHDEARIVDAIRTAGHSLLSLVAEDDSGIVGHILFTPVTIETPGAVSPAAGGLFQLRRQGRVHAFPGVEQRRDRR